MPGKPRHIYFSPDDEDMLEALKEEMGMSVSEIVGEGLRSLVECDPRVKRRLLEDRLRELNGQVETAQSQLEVVQEACKVAEKVSEVSSNAPLTVDIRKSRQGLLHQRDDEPGFRRLIGHLSGENPQLQDEARNRLGAKLMRMGDDHPEWLDRLDTVGRSQYEAILRFIGRTRGNATTLSQTRSA